MELFDGKMKLDIPEDFRRLSDEEKGCFFHGDVKPQVVLEDAAGGQLALLLTDKMAQSVHLDSICSDFYFLIRQRYPACFFLEKGRLKLQDEILSVVFDNDQRKAVNRPVSMRLESDGKAKE